jgi:hypothetical protein
MYLIDINFVKEENIVRKIFNFLKFETKESSERQKFSSYSDIEMNAEEGVLYWNPEKIKHGSLFLFLAKLISASPEQLEQKNFFSTKNRYRDEAISMGVLYVVFSERFSIEWIAKSLKSIFYYKGLKTSEKGFLEKEKIKKILFDFIEKEHGTRDANEFSALLKQVENEFKKAKIFEYVNNPRT